MTASAHLDLDSAESDRAQAAPVRPHRWKVFGASWAILSLLSIIWAMSTPISASPDEPAHIIKAASVARGQFVGETTSFGQVVQVPRYVASTHYETCYAFHSDISAACSAPMPGDPAEIVDAPTSAGLYNPLYYVLVGWPTLFFGDDTGIFVMRALGAVLTSLFLAFTVMIAYGLRRNALPLAGVAVALPPMLMFLGGSVNPNAVEVTGTLAVFAAMLAIVTQPNPRLLTERAVIVAAGAAIAVNTRGLSPLWVLLAILTPLLLTSWSRIWTLVKKTPVLWAIGVTAVSTLFALGWLMSTNNLTAMQDDPDYFQSFPGVGLSPISGFIMTVRDTLGYAQAMIANFGWLDTPPPMVVYFLWAALVGTLLLAAFSSLRGRALVFAAALAAAMVFIPAIIQGAYITNGGIIWQGRYGLPLFAMLVFGLAVLVSERITLPSPSTLNRLTFLVWGMWAIGQYVSFASALKRYAVGSDGIWKNIIAAPEWSAPGGNLLWLIVFGLVLAVATVAGWRLTFTRLSRLQAAQPTALPAELTV